MPVQSLLSPASLDGNSNSDASDGRPPTKKVRLSMSPGPKPVGEPAESMGGELIANTSTSPPAAIRFQWSADPYAVDRDLTMAYTRKYFDHVDSATTCMLPKNAFLRWIRESHKKTEPERMLLYAILAMGTVFSLRPDA
jgi:hypothetical protein